MPNQNPTQQGQGQQSTKPGFQPNQYGSNNDRDIRKDKPMAEQRQTKSPRDSENSESDEESSRGSSRHDS